MTKENKTYISILDEILPIEFILKALRKEIEENTSNKMKALELAMKARGIDRVTLNIESGDNFEESSRIMRELGDELNRLSLEDEEENNKNEVYSEPN